jgi:pilus assembly protein Flp/PilA
MDILNTMKTMAADFAREEEGSQVVEYGLIIALVSIALAIGLAKIAGASPFSALATRIATCLGGTGTCT